MTAMDVATATATAMDGTTWKVRRQRGGDDDDGRGDGDSDGRGDGNGDRRRDGNATVMTAMDSARATAIDGTAATRRQRKVQRRLDGNGRPVVVANIQIEEEEITREYEEGAALGGGAL